MFFGNFALLGFQAFNEYFWERGSSGKYPTHFKKITSYAFLLISKILQPMSPRGLVTMYGSSSGKQALLGWVIR